jgi:hypothetical protein
MSVGFGGLDNSMEDGGVVDAREPDELEPEGNEAGNSGWESLGPVGDSGVFGGWSNWISSRSRADVETSGGKSLRASLFKVGWPTAGGVVQVEPWLVTKWGWEYGSGEKAGSLYNVGGRFLIFLGGACGAEDLENLNFIGEVEAEGALGVDEWKNWENRLFGPWGTDLRASRLEEPKLELSILAAIFALDLEKSSVGWSTSWTVLLGFAQDAVFLCRLGGMMSGVMVRCRIAKIWCVECWSEEENE